MGQIKVTRCEIEGLMVIEPKVHRDERGYFVETYNERDLEEEGFFKKFVQDNQSMSSGGVLRGLHYQKQFPQGKLVRVLFGKVFDVAVDIRRGSKTYGHHVAVELTEENHRQLFLPKGMFTGSSQSFWQEVSATLNDK